LRVAAIRIDVHHAEENPINAPHAFHARFTYGPGPYISRGSHEQPFVSPHKVEIGPYTEKCLATKNRLVQPSSWVASFFLPCDSPGVGERGFGPVVTQLLQLTGSINARMRLVRSILTRVDQPIGP
jgi:hypothetical protein